MQGLQTRDAAHEDVPEWFRQQHEEWLARRNGNTEAAERRWRTQRRYAAACGGIVGFLSAIYLGTKVVVFGPVMLVAGTLGAWVVTRFDLSMPAGGLAFAAPLVVACLVGSALGWAEPFADGDIMGNAFFWVWQLYLAFGVALSFLTERERNEYLPY